MGPLSLYGGTTTSISIGCICCVTVCSGLWLLLANEELAQNFARPRCYLPFQNLQRVKGVVQTVHELLCVGASIIWDIYDG